ncbi:MAG TPA: cytochrome P450 [Candidatus Dormibacteraeota bacterium]|nr:cytochrome P450 [Candidatus Dormibacteraeota bacterium]
MAVTEDLPALPFERPTILDAPPLLLRLQAEGPVRRVRTPAGDVAWLVTGYENVRALLGDDRLGRSHPEPERAPRFSSAAFLSATRADPETEKAQHSRMRRLLTRSFLVRRMHALRPAIQAIVDDLLDRLAACAPPGDLHAALSMPLPVLVICELLGVPYEDRDQFREWSDDASNLFDAARAGAGYRRLNAYMADLVRRRRNDLREDVISDLLAASREEPGLTDEGVAQLGAGLLFAGHETTMTRLDLGALLLLTHPEQRRALAANATLVEGAVEEILRFASGGQGVLPRYASASLDVGGAAIEAGDLVLLAVGAANRDDRAFAEADRFDIQRGDGQHLGFGYGSHFCLGAGLARVELQVGLGTLVRQFPGLQLAVPVEELRQRDDLLTGGLASLPVRW